MKKKTKIIVIVIVIIMQLVTLCVIPFLFLFGIVSCMAVSGDLDANSPEEQAEIKAMFDGFSITTDPIVLVTSGGVFCVGNTQKTDLYFEGEGLRDVVCLEEGIYSFTYEPDTDYTEVNVLLTPYDTLIPERIGGMTISHFAANVEYRDGCLYFRTDDPEVKKFHQLYYIYDLHTGETYTRDSDDEEFSNLETSLDHNKSQKYKMSYRTRFLDVYYEITDRTTNETKRIKTELVKECEEGKAIWEASRKGKYLIQPIPIYEKDGVIYLACLFQDTGTGWGPCHWFFLKYDFDTESVEYYTSFYFEEYQKHICDMFIQ